MFTVLHVGCELTSPALLAAKAKGIADVVIQLIAGPSSLSGIQRSLKVAPFNLILPKRQKDLIRLTQGRDCFESPR